MTRREETMGLTVDVKSERYFCGHGILHHAREAVGVKRGGVKRPAPVRRGLVTPMTLPRQYQLTDFSPRKAPQAKHATKRRSTSNSEKRSRMETRNKLKGGMLKMVPVEGIEPPLPLRKRILNPSRLPIPPHRRTSTKARVLARLAGPGKRRSHLNR